MSNITVSREGSALAFEPRDPSEALKIAQVLVASRLLPKAISTPEAAFAVIMTGRELGLTAMQSLRSVHIIEGKPTMSADLMVALCKRAAVCRYFSLVESTAERATYETQRTGDPSPTRMSFTLDEAKMAGVAGKDNWKKFPAAMLRARAASALVRAVYPDVLLGVYDSDSGELEDAAPAPAPVIVEAVPEPSRAEEYARRIEAADTIEALALVAVDVRNDRLLAPDDAARLRNAYRAHKAELDAAAAPAREPGEEG